MKNLNLNIEQQSGAALITALILLVILTMLGLSNMSSTTMEERMASNTQLMSRVFQAAETGLQIVFSDTDAFDTTLTEDADGTSDDKYANKYNSTIGGSSSNSYEAVATYNSVFKQETKPPRGSGWDSSFSYYHFDLSATGCVVTDNTDTDCSSSAVAMNSLHQGAYQVGKAQ